MNHDHKWSWARKGPGFGPPWMKNREGFPFGMMKSRMFGQGDLRLVLLALIADKPSHGYDLIRTIEAKFGGSYSPSPGTIYPTLTLLEEQDLIAPQQSGGSKKTYEATDKGKVFLAENAEALKTVMAKIDTLAQTKSTPQIPESIMQALHNLRHALMAKGAWTAEEEADAVANLKAVAKKIAR